ncbi:host attachment protein [Limnohabitans sp.]
MMPCVEKFPEAFQRKEKIMHSLHAILLANSSLARLFERSGSQQPWVEVQDWWHVEGRMHPGDLEPMSQGHSMAGRTGLAPHTHIRHRERVDFARELADGLKHALATYKWHSLEIFASAAFLGDLLAQLEPDVQKIVHRTHPLDLTSLSVHDIEKRWNKEFRV